MKIISKFPNSSISITDDGVLVHKSSHRGFPTQYWIDHVAKMELAVMEATDEFEKAILEGMLLLDRAALQDALARDAEGQTKH